MYIILVLLQTLVLPIASGTIQLALTHGDVVQSYGLWFLFWAIGTRLLVAGVSQVARPDFTVQNILGAANPGAAQIAQELGFANLAIGATAMAAPFLDHWAVPLGIVGGLFMGLAGLRHLPKKNPNAKEAVATWTDLLAFVAMAVFSIYSIVTAQPAPAL